MAPGASPNTEPPGEVTTYKAAEVLKVSRQRVDEHLRDSDDLGLVDNDERANPLIRG